MTTSRIFAAVNALVSITQNVFADTDVVVYDGPQVGFPQVPEFVMVGCGDPSTEGIAESVTNGQQDWLSDGSNDPDRQESFSILSAYSAWIGDGGLAQLRANAATNIGLIETAIRLNLGPNDPDGRLGTNTIPGPLAPTGWASLSIREMRTFRGPKGISVAQVTFSVDCWTRI